MKCPAVPAREPARREVLRRMRSVPGSRLYALRHATTRWRKVLSRMRPAGGGGHGSRDALRLTADYTPKHLAEQILTSDAALEGERKQVTVLFADLKGSMELLADRDPEEARAAPRPRARAHDGGRAPLRGHRQPGDGRRHHGAVRRAARPRGPRRARLLRGAAHAGGGAAATPRRCGAATGSPIQIRVGLNSGEVVVRSIGNDLHMDYTAVGQTTHLAARMEQLAMPGSILLTAETLRWPRATSRSSRSARCRSRAWPSRSRSTSSSARAVRTRLQAAAARGLTRFVGRDAELETARGGPLERAGAGHGQVVALVGEPGVGKSRLLLGVHPLAAARTAGWSWKRLGLLRQGHRVPAGDRPAQATSGSRRATTDAGAIREKVTGKLLDARRRAAADRSRRSSRCSTSPWTTSRGGTLDPPQRRQRHARRGQAPAAAREPGPAACCSFEDLHWIDSETQALLDSLVESLPTARLLLLVNYRPEYQHAWGGKTYYTQLRLDPLPPASAEELLRTLLGEDAAFPPLKRLLIERTEGNPFFLEESVRTLVETGCSPASAGAYRLVKPARRHLEVPATVQAVLAARIDRLPPEDKRLLQAAAVIGKDVPLRAAAGHRRAGRTSCAAGSRTSRRPSSSTRPALSRSRSTRSSTR